MSIRRGEEETPFVSRAFFFLTAGFVLALDQITKFLAENFLIHGRSVPILPHVFHLTLVENKGIAFGLFQGMEGLLFVVITASIIILAILGWRSQSMQTADRWAFSLILGGALGNWIDRIRVGAVIDFLDFRIWPVFNLADNAITIGVCLFFLTLLKGTGKSRVS